MTPFETSAGGYSPGLALLLGALTWAGWLGVGTAALRACRVEVAGPWRALVSVVAGVLLTGWVVQLLAFVGAVSRDALFGVFVIGLGVGGWTLAGSLKRPKLPGRDFDILLLYFALPALACVGAGALVAMAPAESDLALAGHVLAVKRVVEDGVWQLYLYPFSAVSPLTLIAPLAGAPLHMLGHFDGADVAGLAVWVTFLFGFARRLLDEGVGSSRWTWLGLAALACTLMAVESYSNGAGAAVGDCSLAALGCYLFRAPEGQTRRTRAVVIGVLAAAGATASLVHGPLAIVMLGVGMWQLRGLAAVGALVPTVAVTLPAVVVTAGATGAALGPWLGPWLGATAWSAEELLSGLAFATDRARYTPLLVLLLVVGFSNLLVWAGVAGCFRYSVGTRRGLGGLFAFQLVIIAVWAPIEPRSLCGLQYVAVLFFALDAPESLREVLTRERVARWVTGLLVVPWAFFASAHATPYAPVAVGAVAPAEWYRDTLPLHRGWAALDEVLPPDAGVVTWDPWIGSKISAAYASRDLFLHPADIPETFAGPLYFLYLGAQPLETVQGHVEALPLGPWSLGSRVFFSEEILWRVRRDLHQGTMRVWELRQAPEKARTQSRAPRPEQRE